MTNGLIALGLWWHTVVGAHGRAKRFTLHLGIKEEEKEQGSHNSLQGQVPNGLETFPPGPTS